MIIELFTYAVAMIVFLIHRTNDLESFTHAQTALNVQIGTLNTLILISSGFFVAEAVEDYKGDKLSASAKKLFVGGLLGIAFLGIKLYEYNSKIISGHAMGDGGFLDYYWGLTAFHFVHVVIGTLLLFAMAVHLKRGKKFADADAGIETGATFWHLCDLIWIMIFPMLYLLD